MSDGAIFAGTAAAGVIGAGTLTAAGLTFQEQSPVTTGVATVTGVGMLAGAAVGAHHLMTKVPGDRVGSRSAASGLIPPDARRRLAPEASPPPKLPPVPPPEPLQSEKPPVPPRTWGQFAKDWQVALTAACETAFEKRCF